MVAPLPYVACIKEGAVPILESNMLPTATVAYTHSLIERIVPGYGVDLGDDIGCDVFEEEYGMLVADSLTVDDVIKAITDKVDSHITCIDEITEGHIYALLVRRERELSNAKGEIALLEDLKPKIERECTGDCPICLELMRDPIFLQPCMHFLVQALP